MRLVVSTLSSLAAAASCGPGLGHLALLQHSAKPQHSLEHRVAAASGGKDQGIWDVMTKITKLGRRLTGEAPGQYAQAEAAHALTTNEQKRVNSSDREALRQERRAWEQRQEALRHERRAWEQRQEALRQERRAWMQRQEAKALARNASQQDNKSETAPAQAENTEAAAALPANVQPGVNSSLTTNEQKRVNASDREALRHERRAWRQRQEALRQERRAWMQRQEAKALARNASRQDMMVQENKSETASAQAETAEAAAALPANVQPSVNSSSYRRGQEANASGRNATEHSTAVARNSTAVVAVQGQAEAAHVAIAGAQQMKNPMFDRQGHDANASAGNASERGTLAMGNNTATVAVQGGQAEAAKVAIADAQKMTHSTFDRTGQQADALARRAAVGNNTTAAAAKGNQTEMASTPAANVRNVNTSSERGKLRWRRRQEAKALARKASADESLVA